MGVQRVHWEGSQSFLGWWDSLATSLMNHSEGHSESCVSWEQSWIFETRCHTGLVLRKMGSFDLLTQPTSPLVIAGSLLVLAFYSSSIWVPLQPSAKPVTSYLPLHRGGSDILRLSFP